jgi:hypothetical protein
MAKPWYTKSKYNNPPSIVYRGTCSNCGATHIVWQKNWRVSCCLETVICDYAVDVNEGKIDCNNTSKCVNNNGMVADLVNEGVSLKEALTQYNKYYWENRKSLYEVYKWKN